MPRTRYSNACPPSPAMQQGRRWQSPSSTPTSLRSRRSGPRTRSATTFQKSKESDHTQQILYQENLIFKLQKSLRKLRHENTSLRKTFNIFKAHSFNHILGLVRTKQEVRAKPNLKINENLIDFFTNSPVVGWSGLQRNGHLCPASSPFRALETIHIQNNQPPKTPLFDPQLSSAHDYAHIVSESLIHYPYLIRSSPKPIHIDVFSPKMVLSEEDEFESQYSKPLPDLFNEASNRLTSALINSFLKGDAKVPTYLEPERRQKFSCILLMKIAREVELQNNVQPISKLNTDNCGWSMSNKEINKKFNASTDKTSKDEDINPPGAASLAPPEPKCWQQSPFLADKTQQTMNTTSLADKDDSGLDDISMSDTSSIDDNILNLNDSDEDTFVPASHHQIGTVPRLKIPEKRDHQPISRPQTPIPCITLSSSPEEEPENPNVWMPKPITLEKRDPQQTSRPQTPIPCITLSSSPEEEPENPNLRMQYTAASKRPHEDTSQKKEETLEKILSSANTGMNDEVT